MYLIIEGMPSSGKTTLARYLSDRYQAEYFKSLLPNDSFGSLVRKIRDEGKNETEITLMHIIDLYRNELQIRKLLNEGKSVIRDKCFLSSLAHFLSVSSDLSPDIQQAAEMAYEELYKNMVPPDALVLLNRSLSKSRQMGDCKSDKTAIDRLILEDERRFLTQKSHLVTNSRKYFGNRIIIFEDSDTPEGEIEIIERELKK